MHIIDHLCLFYDGLFYYSILNVFNKSFKRTGIIPI